MLTIIRDNIMRRLSLNMPAKPPFVTMCLQDNLADCKDSGGLTKAVSKWEEKKFKTSSINLLSIIDGQQGVNQI